MVSRQLRLSVGGDTHIGMRRKQNQDSLAGPDGIDPQLLARKGYLYAVADGLGGYAGGKAASQIAVRRVLDEYYTAPSDQIALSLRRAIQAANRAVCEEGLKPEHAGAGTTIVAAVIHENQLVVANVGDSRAYLVRQGRIRRLTEDHSWVVEQVKTGVLNPEDTLTHPQRHVVTRTLGGEPAVDPDIVRLGLRPADTVLLCTDGLTETLTDAEILQIVNQNEPEPAVADLIRQANNRGGPDNITALVIRVMSTPPARSLAVRGLGAGIPPPILVGVVASLMIILVAFGIAGRQRFAVRSRQPIAAPRLSVIPTETSGPTLEPSVQPLPSATPAIPGDVTGDGVVDIRDAVTIGQAYNTSPPRNPAADVNGDGRVNLFDLILVASALGSSSSPEQPAAP